MLHYGMRIYLQTYVSRRPQDVFSRFNHLFLSKLKPPFLSMHILKFEGCKLGDELHIKVGFGKFMQQWVSAVTAYKNTANVVQFVDEASILPKPLASWKHAHRIVAFGHGSLIIDDITYQCTSPWMEYILYPFLWLQFTFRTLIYRRVFGG